MSREWWQGCVSLTSHRTSGGRGSRVVKASVPVRSPQSRSDIIGIHQSSGIPGKTARLERASADLHKKAAEQRVSELMAPCCGCQWRLVDLEKLLILPHIKTKRVPCHRRIGTNLWDCFFVFLLARKDVRCFPLVLQSVILVFLHWFY